jgi:hypothetical protein
MSEYAWTETEPRLRVAAEAPSVKTADMIRIPGGTFRMGSDKHYPEETPVHRVTVSDFWIDRTPRAADRHVDESCGISMRRAGTQGLLKLIERFYTSE